MSPRSVDEVHPIWEHQDEDPEINNLLEFLRQDNSLSTITWQALPEYPLTPIECNKRRRVASQRKSKKPKKVARDGQENIADGGEKRGDIAKTEEHVQSDEFLNSGRISFQRLFEKVEVVEKLFLPVSAVFQSAGGITMDNLASRLTRLEEIAEEIMPVKTPAHDRLSNTKLPAKPVVCHSFQ